jgi:outer membrane receptor protein involved in Fe transport
MTLAVYAGRGFRAPNVFDFSQLGPRPGNRFARPTADLEPEVSISVDAGVKAALGGLSAQLFGFWLRVGEKIEALPTGEVQPDGRVVVESANVNRVRECLQLLAVGVTRATAWQQSPTASTIR